MEQLVEALRALQTDSRPAIDAKASVLGELERLLLECKAFVEAYLSKGSMSRMAGAMLSSDKTKLEGFLSRIDSLILRFGFIDRAEAAKQAGGAGKASDGIARFGKTSRSQQRWAQAPQPMCIKASGGTQRWRSRP